MIPPPMPPLYVFPPPSPWPFMNTGTNTDATEWQIGQTDVMGGFEGTWDMGEIFPLGMMTVEELAQWLSLAKYASALGSGGEFDLIVIPEPGTMALLAIGGALVLIRRRRK